MNTLGDATLKETAIPAENLVICFLLISSKLGGEAGPQQADFFVETIVSRYPNKDIRFSLRGGGRVLLIVGIVCLLEHCG